MIYRLYTLTITDISMDFSIQEGQKHFDNNYFRFNHYVVLDNINVTFFNI